MNCPICGKQRMYNNETSYTISTPMQSGTVSFNSDYCLGMCSGITATNTTATIQINGVVLPVHNFHMEMITDGEKPLEWSEVEQQLDDFMAELNERDNDDPT